MTGKKHKEFSGENEMFCLVLGGGDTDVCNCQKASNSLHCAFSCVFNKFEINKKELKSPLHYIAINVF